MVKRKRQRQTITHKTRHGKLMNEYELMCSGRKTILLH